MEIVKNNPRYWSEVKWLMKNQMKNNMRDHYFGQNEINIVNCNDACVIIDIDYNFLEDRKNQQGIQTMKQSSIHDKHTIKVQLSW